MLPSVLIALTCIFVISFLRKSFVFELQSISLLVTGSSRLGYIFYTILLLPGTILHELSHWIFAELLRVPTGEISLLPDLSSDPSKEKKLGYVMTARSDPFRGFLIGVAPTITGLSSLALLSHISANFIDFNTLNWQLVLIIYLYFVISNSMITSKQDRKYLPFMLIFMFIIIVALYLSDITLSPSYISYATDLFNTLNKALYITIAVNIVLYTILFILRKISEKVTRKRISRS